MDLRDALRGLKADVRVGPQLHTGGPFETVAAAAEALALISDERAGVIVEPVRESVAHGPLITGAAVRLRRTWNTVRLDLSRRSSDRGPALVPPAFRRLPLGTVRPAGWLLNQLRIQARGLPRHLDEFWPDIADSGWIGGKAEGWERGPYWLDGLIPLAWLLDDASLKNKVRRCMNYILEHQQPDGWLEPVRDPKGQSEPRDPWPVYVALKALVQDHEATGDTRVPDAMARFFCALDLLLDERPLHSWARARWADLALSIHWLFDRTGESWLLELAAKVREQGYDWQAHFDRFRFKRRIEQARDGRGQRTHVVNNAMAVKQPGVWFRQSALESDRAAASKIIRILDRYHGQATGVFAGDERYAGRSPSQGTELCDVVEYMF